MKKTLMAVAVLAAFSGAAQAQTSVTLYGLIDAGIGYTNVKGSWTNPATGVTSQFDGSRTGMTDGQKNGTRWGLRGREDLGNGTSAVFTLESRFGVSDGNLTQGGRLFGGEATVGLANDSWGEFRLGRQYNVGSRYFGDLFGAPFGGFLQNNIGTQGFTSADFMRYDNLLVYQTPNFGGFRAGVGYSFGTDDQRAAETGFRTNESTRAITAGLKYENGPLAVALTYDQLNPSSKLSTAQTDATPRSYVLGASYDFEVVKALLAYSRTTDGWFTGQSLPQGATIGGFSGIRGFSFADGFRANSYLVAAALPLGANATTFASWERVDPNNNSLTGGDSTVNSYTLGYSYNLSKRTDVYAVGSYTKNYAFLSDAKATEVSVGVRHRF